MGECFITRRGGGGTSKAFAVIGVTYPAGSVCTCSDGAKTLSLKDTGGQGFFLIPYAATWTVTATDGTNTKSESVEITSEGQSVSVELSYVLYLIKNGVVLSPFVLKSKDFKINIYQGSSSVNGNVATLSQGTVVYFDPFDISKYTRLTVELETSDVVQWINFGLDATVDYFRDDLKNNGMAAVLNIPGGVELSRKTYTLDISKVEGTGFYTTLYSWFPNQAQLIIQNLYYN